jgi:hypothetical protein
MKYDENQTCGGLGVICSDLFDELNARNEELEQCLRHLMRLTRQSARSGDAVKMATAYRNAENAISVNHGKNSKDKGLPRCRVVIRPNIGIRRHPYRPTLWTLLKGLLLLGSLHSRLRKTQKREFALSQKSQGSSESTLLVLGECLGCSCYFLSKV